MNRLYRRLALILVVLLIVPTGPVFAAGAVSKSVKLSSYDGTIKVKKGGTELSKVAAGIRLFDGYNLLTANKSYAFLELDSSKFVKVDQNSNIKIAKKGNKNQLNVASGALFFNVTKPLKKNEKMEVKTVNMTMGVRGTTGTVVMRPDYDASGKVEKIQMDVQIYTGKGYVNWANETTGASGETVVMPGNQVAITVDVATNKQSVEQKALESDGSSIPVVALSEIVKMPEVLSKIKADTKIDVKALDSTLKQQKTIEEKKVEQELSKADSAAAEFKKTVSESVQYGKDVNTKEQGSAGNPAESKPESGGSGGGGNSGGGNTGGDSGGESTEVGDILTGPAVTCGQLESALKSKDSVTVSGMIMLDRDLTIPHGKALNLATGSGIDFINDSKLKVEGSLNNFAVLEVAGEIKDGAGASLSNKGTISITEDGIIECRGLFLNEGIIDIASGGALARKTILLPFYNKGTINNTGVLSVGGEILNNGTLNNSGSIDIVENGKISNNHTMNNSGNIELLQGGMLSNEKDGTFKGSGSVKSSGTGPAMINHGKAVYNGYMSSKSKAVRGDRIPGGTVINGGTLEINGGIIENNAAATGGAMTSDSSPAIYNSGILEIIGGLVKSGENSKCIIGTDDSELIVEGGSISGGTGIAVSGGRIRFSGGTILGGETGIEMLDHAELEMTGGKVDGITSGIQCSTADIQFKDGAVFGGETGIKMMDNAELEMTGGEANGNLYGIQCSTADIQLSGGRIVGKTAGLYCTGGNSTVVIRKNAVVSGNVFGIDNHDDAASVTVEGGIVERAAGSGTVTEAYAIVGRFTYSGGTVRADSDKCVCNFIPDGYDIGKENSWFILKIKSNTP